MAFSASKEPPLESDLGDFAETLRLARLRGYSLALEDVNVRVQLATEIYRRTRSHDDLQQLQAYTVLQTNIEAMIAGGQTREKVS